MKRYLIALSILSFIFTSCSKITNDTTQVEDNTSSPVELTTVKETDKYYSADGIELRIDMSQYSEKAKLLTADNIYLLSFNCGYIYENAYDMLIIENEEQLDCALKKYGLALPSDELTEDELWNYNTAIVEPFHEMMYNYPISDYSYVIEYDEVATDGYDLKVGALLVDSDNLHFVYDSESHTPDADLGEGFCDVMGGFCYMAALPKGMLMNEHYANWTYPEVNSIREAYYKESVNDDIAVDAETGLQYIKNQLLISAFIDTEQSEIEDIVKEINAEIVGMIELTGDYQIEFKEDKTLEELEAIANYINNYPFISNVTLNFVNQLYFDVEEVE